MLNGLRYVLHVTSRSYSICCVACPTQYGRTPIYSDNKESDIENYLVVSVSILMLLFAVTNNPVDISEEGYVRSEHAFAGKTRIAYEKRLPHTKAP